MVWIRFWLQENSSVNQTQIIIINFSHGRSWRCWSQGWCALWNQASSFLLIRHSSLFFLSDHRCPKSCFNSNLHVVILASKKKERKLEESCFLGKITRICTCHLHGHFRGQNLAMWTHSAPRYLGMLLYSCHPYACLKFGEYSTAKGERTIF